MSPLTSHHIIMLSSPNDENSAVFVTLTPSGISHSSLTGLSPLMQPVEYATSDYDWIITLDWPLTNSVLMLQSDMNNPPPKARSAADPPAKGSHAPVHPLA